MTASQWRTVRMLFLGIALVLLGIVVEEQPASLLLTVAGFVAIVGA